MPQILHIDMDAFFASVEELLHPELAGREVIVGGDPQGRGVVACANYPARARGVHSGMPLSQAARLAPEAVFTRGSFGIYGEFSRRLRAILEDFTPEVEMVGLEEAYLDLRGCRHLWGTELAAAHQIRRRVGEELGLPCTIGIAGNKVCAKIASKCGKPRGILLIPDGSEASFLDGLAVGIIPGVGGETLEVLASLNVRTAGELARLPEEVVKGALGPAAVTLIRRARGDGSCQLSTDPGQAKSVSRETTFASDISPEDDLLREHAFYLLQRCCHTLRQSGKACGNISLKIRYADFTTVQRSTKVVPASSNELELWTLVQELFATALQRRQRVRLIGLRLASLVPGMAQHSLFAREQLRRDRLLPVLDHLRQRYGFGSIDWGRSRPRPRGEE